MTLGKTLAWSAIFAIPCLFWAWISSARNDLAARTHFLVTQVQHIDIRNERAEQSFFIRSRYPTGNPDRQELLFARLWDALHGCEPESIESEGGEVTVQGEDGEAHPLRRVRISGKSSRDGSATLVLEWQKFRGSWYITDFVENGERASRRSAF